MEERVDFGRLLPAIQEIVSGRGTRDEKLLAICQFLKNEVPYYNWVGFYLVEPGEEQVLVLGPFAGAPTEHTKISFGQGICGQAAETENTFIIQDVSLETNYLSCSPDVKSEIVIPLFKGDQVVGELDIDSHLISPFTDQDQEFLEHISLLVAGLC
ncbi:MAG: GAF domain-containing protein [Anaerolineae bacterium]|nr:GAF domain-containing protein [Anaerolineae bacterium]